MSKQKTSSPVLHLSEVFKENSTFYKLAGLMASFAEIKVVAAMRDGFIITTPFTIVGSL